MYAGTWRMDNISCEMRRITNFEMEHAHRCCRCFFFWVVVHTWFTWSIRLLWWRNVKRWKLYESQSHDRANERKYLRLFARQLNLFLFWETERSYLNVNWMESVRKSKTLVRVDALARWSERTVEKSVRLLGDKCIAASHPSISGIMLHMCTLRMFTLRSFNVQANTHTLNVDSRREAKAKYKHINSRWWKWTCTHKIDTCPTIIILFHIWKNEQKMVETKRLCARIYLFMHSFCPALSFFLLHDVNKAFRWA